MNGISSGLLAAFVWPALFWGGAGAVSVPILIHLLARRRFKRIRWAAMAFLRMAEQRNRRRVRLEDFILMMMRCLAVLLLAMLIARPFFRPEGLAALLGGSERTERIFVIDDSFSMGYASGDDTVFDRAKRGATQLIDLLREQSPRDTVTVLRTSAIDAPVATGVYLDTRLTEDLSARLEGMTVSQHALSPRDVFQAVRRLLDERTDAVNIAVYVLSDFQRVNWIAPDGQGDGNSSPIAPLAEWQGRDKELNLILVDVGDDRARNLSIANLSSRRSRFVAAVEETIVATVANHSDRAAEALNLEVFAGPSPQPTVTVERVGEGDTLDVSVSLAFERPGWNWTRVVLPGDALPIDDTRTLAVQATEAARVLIVNGEPSSDAFRDEVTLLVTALRPSGEVFSGNELEVIDETELEDVELSNFDAVLLANVYRVSETATAAMEAFVSGGGGLGLFLGDQVDPDFYNATLYADGLGLLPARLTERVAPAVATQLVADDYLNPVVRVFAGADNPLASLIQFEQYFATSLPAPTDGPETGPTLGLPKVIAHYADGNGTPAIIERSYGQGRVVMLTSSCDQEWNDWGKAPSYVVSILELSRYLTRGRGIANDLVVGVPIEFSIDPDTYADDVRVRTPAYPAEQEITLTAAPIEDRSGFWVRWDQTPTSGLYRFVLTRQTGEQESRAFAVNLDPDESDLRPALEADLKESLHEMDVHYVAGLESLGSVGDDARREFWKTLLIAAFVVLMGEQLLGWWFGRRT